MTFYNTNDLLIRRVKTAQWLTDQITEVTNSSFYGELMCCEDLIQLEYVSAALEAIECYTPITDEDEDGVNNCLTEEQLDDFFNNIVDITGLCFPDKGQTYDSNVWTSSTITLTTNTASGVTTSSGVTISTTRG